MEGSTENATVVTDLLVGLRDRGLDLTRPILVGIDGAKALRKAVVDVFGHPVIQRCRLHRSATSPTGCPSGYAARSERGCGRPTTQTPPSTPRPS